MYQSEKIQFSVPGEIRSRVLWEILWMGGFGADITIIEDFVVMCCKNT